MFLSKRQLSLCSYTEVPVLGCEPEVATLYSSKSGARRIFEDANIDRGSAETDIYSITQVSKLFFDVLLHFVYETSLFTLSACRYLQKKFIGSTLLFFLKLLFKSMNQICCKSLGSYRNQQSCLVHEI